MSATSKKCGVDLSTIDVKKLTKKQLAKLTTKEQRAQLKKNKKESNLKTQAERAAEVADIKQSLLKWELNERFLPIAQLFLHLEHFVRTGEKAIGKIPFPEAPPAPLGRDIVYQFTNIRGQKGTCDLIVRDAQAYLAEDKATAAAHDGANCEHCENGSCSLPTSTPQQTGATSWPSNEAQVTAFQKQLEAALKGGCSPLEPPAGDFSALAQMIQAAAANGDGGSMPTVEQAAQLLKVMEKEALRVAPPLRTQAPTNNQENSSAQPPTDAPFAAAQVSVAENVDVGSTRIEVLE